MEYIGRLIIFLPVSFRSPTQRLKRLALNNTLAHLGTSSLFAGGFAPASRHVYRRPSALSRRKCPFTLAFRAILTGDPRGRPYLRRVEGRTTALSFITVGELLFGAFWRDWGDRRTADLQKRLEAAFILPLDHETSVAYARPKSGLRRQGQGPPSGRAPRCRLIVLREAFHIPHGCRSRTRGFHPAISGRPPQGNCG